MKYCTNCGFLLNDDACFCTNCGSPCYSNQQADNNVYDMTGYDLQVEQECLDRHYRFIKWERLAWKIEFTFALISFIVIEALFFIFLLAGIGVTSSAANEEEMGVGMVFILVGIVYMVYVAIFMLPPIIVTGIMKKKRQALMDQAYTNYKPALDTYSSAGCIVISAIFGVVSVVFAIIHFVMTKKEKRILDNIVANQSAANNTYFSE